MLEHGVRISVYNMHIFFACTLEKCNFLIYAVRNYHKQSNQIIYVFNCQIFTSAIKLSLIHDCS
jgi:hypothetical protein